MNKNIVTFTIVVALLTASVPALLGADVSMEEVSVNERENKEQERTDPITFEKSKVPEIEVPKANLTTEPPINYTIGYNHTWSWNHTWEETIEMPIYNYSETTDINGDEYPINMHLCIEVTGYLYFVPLSNIKTIIKVDVSDGSTSTITTESGAVTVFYHDRSNSKLYYYHNQATISYVDLSDDSVTDLSGTLDAVEDIFIYDGDVWAIDASEDDLTFYKYNTGTSSWDASGTVSDESVNGYDIGGLGGNDIPYGICWDGTYFYVTDHIDAYIYQYNAAFDTKVAEHDIGALGGNDSPYGICWDGTYFYVLDADESYIYQYNAALDTLIDSYNLGSISEGENEHPWGICWDGTCFYVTDYQVDEIYKYNAALDTLISSHDIGSLVGIITAQGICWDGTYFYVVNSFSSYIHKFNTNLDILIDTYDIGALGGNDFPRGICWDENYFHVVDYDDAYVYKYHSDFTTEMGAIWYSLTIGTYQWVIYQYITGDAKIYKKDLTDTSNPVLQETLSSDYLVPYLHDQRGVAYDDSDVLYFVIKDKTDDLTYLISYEITDGTVTKLGEFNVGLMLNRNTNDSNDAPFNLEKAIGVESSINDLTVYQIPASFQGYIYPIAVLDDHPDLNGLGSDEIVAVTDTYLVVKLSGGGTELWTFQDMDDHVVNVKYGHYSVGNTHDEFTLSGCRGHANRKKFPLAKNMVIRIYQQYTANTGGGADKLVFEGRVVDYEERYQAQFKCVGLDAELKNVNPSGDYSGRTDEIISSFISTDLDYITEGTLSSGVAMGTLTYKQKKSILQAIEGFQDRDGFLCYTHPNGTLDYNDASVDSGADLRNDGTTYTDKIWNVVPTYPSRQVNKVIVFGGIDSSSGDRYSGSATDEEDIRINGVKTLVMVDATLNSDTKCGDVATAVLSRDGSNPLTVEFNYSKSSVGHVQVGETLTFKFTLGDYDITEAQFIVLKSEYNYSGEVGWIKASSALLITRDKDKVDEHGELIDQNAGNLSTHEADTDNPHSTTNQNLECACAFHVERDTSTQEITSGGWNKVEWQVEVFDIGSDFDLANDKFVAPVAGVYQFSASILLKAEVWSAGDSAYLAIHVNGTRVKFMSRWECEDGETKLMHLTGAPPLLSLSADDEVTIYISQTADAHDIYKASTAGEYTWFSGHLIGKT